MNPERYDLKLDLENTNTHLISLTKKSDTANTFGFDLHGAVIASDAFFPFPDCVEIAKKEGVNAVVQPGGSIKDQESIDYCDANDMAMVTTGIRHFKH